MSRRTKAAAAALAALAALATPAGAGPPVAGPSGDLCRFSAQTDPFGAPGDMMGTIRGKASGSPGAGGALSCSIQVQSHYHGAPDVVHQKVYADATGTAVMDPRVIAYPMMAGAGVYLCSQWTDQIGNQLYWHAWDWGADGIPGTADDTPGHWTTDAMTPCVTASQTSFAGTDYHSA